MFIIEEVKLVDIGYINFPDQETYFLQQFKALKKSKVRSIIIEKELTFKFNNTFSTLDEIVMSMNEQDTLTVYELRCLGKTLQQLILFLQELELKKVTLKILNKGLKLTNCDDETFKNVIFLVAQLEVESEKVTNSY